MRAAGLLVVAAALLVCGAAESPIHFAYRRIAFTLENGETERRHAPETMAGGVAAFDYDGDGDLDLYFVNGSDMPSLRKSGPKQWNRLFANDGNGGFTDVTAKSGLEGTGFDNGVAVADYDNDGDKDVFVGGVHGYALYRNNGRGRFEDVTKAAGLSHLDPEYGALWSVGGAWLDYDNDGLLDLFVTNYLLWDPKTEQTCGFRDLIEYCHPKFYKETPNRLYRNLGKGRFADVSAETGIRAYPGKGMGAAVADFDLDGRIDIFVSNDKLYNFLFRNRGGKFEEIALPAGVAVPEHGAFISGMGVDFRDFDNDEYPDLSVIALDNETFPLYRNTGKGQFREVTAPTGMGKATNKMAGYSPGFFDFDNDGRKDLFVSRGHVQSPRLKLPFEVDQHNSVFRNVLAGPRVVMSPLTEEAGFTSRPPLRHRGSAFGDFNGDGTIDVAVVALSAEAELWINDSPRANHWIAFALEGTKSARDAVGARIKVTTKSGTQYNHVTSAVGYASSSAGPVHFGLGADTVVDSVEIRWPSGTVQTLREVRADRVLRVRESAS